MVASTQVLAQRKFKLRTARVARNATGADLIYVISWRVLLVDVVDISRAYDAIAPGLASAKPPLVTANLVSALGLPGALIEISAVAARFD